MNKRVLTAVAIAAAALPLVLEAQIGTFAPDWTFSGSALPGARQIGQATWRAENGEIVGTPTGAAGGWLFLDRSYQDVQVGGEFRCAGACTVGLLIRSEQTPQGTSGLYGVLAGAERAAQAVVVDGQGALTNVDPLARPATGQYRLAPAMPPPGTGGRAGGAARAGGPPPAPAAPFVSRFPNEPATAFKPGDWNGFEVIMDADIYRLAVNAGRPAGYLDAGAGLAVAVDGKGGSFGPIALHVGGTGEVRFRKLAIKDLNARTTPAEAVSPRFRAQRIDDYYRGWSMTAGDFNHDGVMDVTVGNRYYLGPTFERSHELYLAQPFNPGKEYGPAMVNFAFDYTGDGWDDILVVESRPPVLYVNPRGESRRWTRHVISPAVTSEAIAFKDVDRDGAPDPIFAGGNVVQWLRRDPANPTAPWAVHVVSAPGPPGQSIHGVGGGDVNGDGRLDIIVPHGWYEQPANASAGPWPFHQAAFGRVGNAGGEFEVFDVNGDNVPDIVTALAAHGFGLAWYEQRRPAGGGDSTWIEHLIMGDFLANNPGGVTFSELHALTAADIDGDGIKDIVTGKRHWAHLESYVDPDPMGAAVVYVFRTVRDTSAPGGARFVPELVHNRSGVGSMVQTADLDKDGAPEIIVGTNTGGWIFWNRRSAAR